MQRLQERLAAVVGLAGVMALLLLAVAAPADAHGQVLRGQYWVSKFRLHDIWKITRGAGVTVAVVDSGVPASPQLGDRLLAGTNLVGCGDGRQDQGESTSYGAVSHGEDIAQIIAGNGVGDTTGVAPAARILPVKVQTRSNAVLDVRVAAKGIRYAVDHGASVVNLSLGTLEGSSGCTSTVSAATRYAYDHDVVVVASSGNDGVPSVSEPANCPGVLAVGGIEASGAEWDSSNYGAETSFANFATDIPGVSLSGRPITANGTSNSAALTSGEVALLRSRFPQDTARQIVTRMLYATNTLGTGKRAGQFIDNHVGYGLSVPYDAVTDKLPANYDVNPIYDRFAKVFGKPDPQRASDGGASNELLSHPGYLFGGVAVVVVLVVIVVLLVTRSGRRRPVAAPQPIAWGTQPYQGWQQQAPQGWQPPPPHQPPPDNWQQPPNQPQ